MAHAGDVFLEAHEGHAVRLALAREELGIGGDRRHRCLQAAGSACRRSGWRASFRGPASLRMRCAVERALVQVHAQEAHVVGRGRIQRVAHAVELGLRRRASAKSANLPSSPRMLTAASRGAMWSSTSNRVSGMPSGSKISSLAELVDARGHRPSRRRGRASRCRCRSPSAHRVRTTMGSSSTPSAPTGWSGARGLHVARHVGVPDLVDQT